MTNSQGSNYELTTLTIQPSLGKGSISFHLISPCVIPSLFRVHSISPLHQPHDSVHSSLQYHKIIIMLFIRNSFYHYVPSLSYSSSPPSILPSLPPSPTPLPVPVPPLSHPVTLILPLHPHFPSPPSIPPFSFLPFLLPSIPYHSYSLLPFLPLCHPPSLPFPPPFTSA